MDDKLQKDELNIYTVIKESCGKTPIKLAIKRFIKHELKQDKHECRIICLDEFRLYLLSINKSQKPSKVEHTINLLSIKKIESLNKNQLTIQTHENHEFKFHNIEDDSADIDDIITKVLKSVKSIFPTVSIKTVIDHVNIQPEKRWLSLEKEIEDLKQTNDYSCASYEKAYMCYCDLHSINAYKAVGYDVNTIYTLNNVKEFCLTDFDYVASKDLLPLLMALRHNSWFESIYSESIKFTNDLQDEICNLLTSQSTKIKSLKLIHSNLKSDFTQKLLNSYQQLTKQQATTTTTNKPTKQFLNYLKCINLSHNSLEDKGATYLSQLFKEFSLYVDIQQQKDVLNYLVLSKCSLNSKGINSLFTTLKDFSTTLRHVDLSFNSLKDHPAELFKFLSESNSLENLNLSNSEVDLDKLFIALSKGGCDKSLKTLVLSGNTNYSTKNFNYDALKQFLNSVQVLNYVDVSSCKLTGQSVQNFINGIQFNDHLKDVHVNLSSNDLSSSLKLFSNEFGYESCITSLDLSDNNFDADFETILKNLRFSSVKHLCLSKNFQNIKPKLLKQSIISPLSKLVCNDSSKIESLWLTDCRLRSHLLDFLNELGSCSNLKLLDISGNDLGDLGINELAKSLQINRSIEILAFDRSNITTPLAYEHIFDALKRNSTLKSLQIPTVDLFNLYQKSPEKIIETIKQMNELTLKRNENLTSENKCNIEQLFKTRMKLLNEPDKSNDINTSSQRDNTLQQTLETKEIFESLNETVCTYLTENNNSLEKQFQQYQQELISKLDTIKQNLEIKINDKLHDKYPKYHTNKLKSDDCNNEKLNNLKEKLKSSMSSLFIQIHNQFSELNYELTETMATKFVRQANIEIQQQQQQQQAAQTVQPVTTTTTTSVPSTPTLQQQLPKPANNTQQQQPQVNINQIQKFQFRNKQSNSTTSDSRTSTSFAAGNISLKHPRPTSYQIHNDENADTTNNANSTNNTSHMESLNESTNNELNDSAHDLYEIVSDSEILEDKTKPNNSTKPERPYMSIIEDDEKRNSSSQSTSLNKETSSSIQKNCDLVTPDSSINKSTYEADANIYDNIDEIVNQPKQSEQAPSPAPRTKRIFGFKQKLEENVTSSPITNTSTATAKTSEPAKDKITNDAAATSSDTAVTKPQEDSKTSDSKPEKRGLVRSILTNAKPDKLLDKLKGVTQAKESDVAPQPIKEKYAPPPPPSQSQKDKDLSQNKEKEITSVKDKDKAEDATLYDGIEPPQEVKKLDHLNKNRAKRANVRKPSKKYIPTQIQTFDLSEDLTIKEEPVAVSPSNEAPPIVAPQPTSAPNSSSSSNTSTITNSNEPARPPPRQLNGTSPLVGAKNGVEQPKVSIVELGGVKLRPTRPKPEINNGVIKEGEELQISTPANLTPTPPINNPISNRFSNRHSSYISPSVQNRISSVQSTFTENTDENSTTKPLTPPALSNTNSTNGQLKLPPQKPPKPLAPKPTITNEQTPTPPPQPQVRLKPVNRNTATIDDTSDQKHKLPIEIEKLDKRRSVRDMANHFLKEESKA